MITLLIILAAIVLVLLYIAATFVTGSVIMDWIDGNGYWGPVAIPLLWTCFWIIAVPLAAALSLLVEGAPK